MNSHTTHHVASTQRSPFHPAVQDTIRVGSRRWFLQTGLAGLGGLSLPGMIQLQAAENKNRGSTGDNKSVILFWLSGGPSQLDTWDPKPEAPNEVRGPFGTISTTLPGVRFSEHLPLQASIAHKLSIIRAVDCKASNHTPITMQAGNPLARRTNDGKDGGGYPSMGSIAAKFRGGNDPDMPPFVGLAKSWTSDVWGAGHMGSEYDPAKGLELGGKFNLPKGIALPRLSDRQTLRSQFDRLQSDLDRGDTMKRFDHYTRRAYEMVVSGKVQKAFDLSQESQTTRDAYGRASVGEKSAPSPKTSGVGCHLRTSERGVGVL